MEISTHQVEMASAAMVHFGMDPRKFVQWMGGKCTGNCCDIHKILAKVKDHILLINYLPGMKSYPRMPILLSV